MIEDDEFTPRLGRQRHTSGKRARRYLGRVVGAAVRSAEKGAIRSRRFDGSRIGRGASMGRLLSSRDRLGAFRARRAVVKTRLVRIGSKGSLTGHRSSWRSPSRPIFIRCCSNTHRSMLRPMAARKRSPNWCRRCWLLSWKATGISFAVDRPENERRKRCL